MPSAMPVGQDRDLVHRVGVLEDVGRDRVATFVERGVLLLFLVHHDGRPLEAHEHAVTRVLEVLAVHRRLAPPDREQRGLVHEVREVRTGHARRAAGDDRDVDVVGDLLVAEVHLQDVDPLFLGGERDHDLAVEPARAQQRGVEDVGPVGGRDHHDARRWSRSRPSRRASG